MESSAKSRSVVPSARITMNIGVITRLPFSLANSLMPCHWSVAGRCVSTHLMSRFSSYSSSSFLPSLASLTAVHRRNRPSRSRIKLNSLIADADEDRAHHQGQHYADHQRFLLVLPGHAELGHDDDEDEQVVDGEGVLRQPAGEELGAELVARADPAADADQDSERDV